MTYLWIINFALLTYLIATDESIVKAIYYITRIVKNKFEIFRWWLIHNPRTPWARYSMWRRSNRLAKELMKELEKKQ